MRHSKRVQFHAVDATCYDEFARACSRGFTRVPLPASAPARGHYRASGSGAREASRTRTFCRFVPAARRGDAGDGQSWSFGWKTISNRRNRQSARRGARRGLAPRLSGRGTAARTLLLAVALCVVKYCTLTQGPGRLPSCNLRNFTILSYATHHHTISITSLLILFD